MSIVAWRKKLPENGRGVADPPVENLVAEPSLSLVPTIDSQVDSLLGSVTADLADAESGVEFVYRSLDRMQRRSEAEDVLVIVDDGPLGRQAFRAGRRPIETNWARELVRSGAAGIHATPAPIDGAVASSVLQLCSLALQLDVARQDSLHDALTGLLNRRAFDEVLATSCAQSQRYGWPFALVLLDLDGFKTVNDRLGHAAGDAALQAVGSELRPRLRVGDTAARIGGDEFAVVLPNVCDAAVPELVERIERTIESAVPDAGVTLSAGYAVSPDDGFRPEARSRSTSSSSSSSCDACQRGLRRVPRADRHPRG
ncbi:MAG: GGDEF domain-containing protein, partial [Actinomycetota bacterium]|nr:GGDEF domain-containing protein [Actinomycetota bacterium]